MRHKRRILLVDDSKTQLVMLQMSFEKMGFDVLTAEDGLEGVSRAFSDQPDMIISDIIMPELNGYQLCRLLKNDQKTSHIPIVLLTSLNQRQDRFWGIRAGADQYIVKNADLTDLKASVTELLKKPGKKNKTEGVGVPVDNKSTEWKSIKSNVNHLLDKLLFESTLSSEARQLANYIHAKDNLLKAFSDLVSSLIEYSGLCLCLVDLRGTKLFFDLKQPLSEKALEKVKTPLLSAMNGSGKKKACEMSFVEGSADIDNALTENIFSKLIVPLNLHNECIGSLAFFSTKKNAFSTESESMIQLLAQDFSMVFKLMLLYDETKELAITDGLTKLYNKRYFLEILEKEFERAKRFNSDLCLILMDIDHFKSINDTYGHVQGDSILKEVGEIIHKSVRKIDFPARYGGEEFVIIAPNTPLDKMVEMAERIRGITESHPFQAEKTPLKLTISLGVAAIHRGIGDALALVKTADDALYQAKHEGRNQVCIAKCAA